MEMIHVVMVRQDLKDIPQVSLADGYRMRPYRRGDRATWLQIQEVSEPYHTVTGQTFDDSFGGDLPAMKGRGLFLVAPDGRDAGTITAWYNRTYARRRWGQIHWVAIVPEHRGKRLSKSMMTVAMNRLRALGHRRAMLGTQTPRIAAIKTYLDFGFAPDMSVDRAQEAWAQVRRALSHPALRKL